MVILEFVLLFGDADLATRTRAAVSEINTFPIVANRDSKEG